MPKITRSGGATNAGFIQRDAGFVDTTAATVQAAAERQAEPEVAPLPDYVPPPFDPGLFSVADVMAERGNCTDAEWAAVLAAERAGKGRAGIK